MKKFLSFILLIFFICSLSFSFVYAVEIDMNLNSDFNDTIDKNENSNVIDNELSNKTTTLNSATSLISTSSANEDFALSFSDVINIIMISVGTVIIILAIAILIRLK